MYSFCNRRNYVQYAGSSYHRQTPALVPIPVVSVCPRILDRMTLIDWIGPTQDTGPNFNFIPVPLNPCAQASLSAVAITAGRGLPRRETGCVDNNHEITVLFPALLYISSVSMGTDQRCAEFASDHCAQASDPMCASPRIADYNNISLQHDRDVMPITVTDRHGN